MRAKDIADFVIAQDQEIQGLQARVKWLEDGLKRMVTCGDTKASAMAWNILNEVAKQES
jgi:hypothetical protein